VTVVVSATMGIYKAHSESPSDKEKTIDSVYDSRPESMKFGTQCRTCINGKEWWDIDTGCNSEKPKCKGNSCEGPRLACTNTMAVGGEDDGCSEAEEKPVCAIAGNEEPAVDGVGKFCRKCINDYTWQEHNMVTVRADVNAANKSDTLARSPW
jgi:hypothetical protein